MKCDKFKRSISLYLDGRLDAAEARELQEHLSQCPRCAEIVASIESVEKVARSAQVPEPPPGYWDTFSSRVTEKIEARKTEPTGFSLKRLAERVFSTPPRRLRLAAGVATIVLAFAVGVMFVERQGERVIPPKLPSPGDKAVSVSENPELGKKAAPTPQTPSQPAPAKEEPKPETVREQTPRQEEPVEASGPSPQVTRIDRPQQEAKKDEAPKQEPAKGDAIAQEKAKAESPAPEEASDAALKSVTAFDVGAARTSATKSARADDGTPRKITDQDTSVTGDELKTLIAQWKNHIDLHPTDPLVGESYRQVATAYVLLARRAPDDAVVAEGRDAIRTYIDRTVDPELRQLLTAKLQEIESLEMK